MARLIQLLTTLVSLLASFASGMNWAQSSGNKTQPIVNPSFNGWTARWGHGLISDETLGFLYLLGGDDYRGSADGGGRFRNDVWRTAGAEWQVFETFFSAKPTIQSRLNWIRVWPDKLAPEGTDYEDWIECFTRKWRGAAPCSPQQDPFSGDGRRWSPRRSHGVTHFNPDRKIEGSNGEALTLWVIGGRASDNPRTDHEAKLKNDVWASADGLTWTLVNPGCRFEDVQHVQGVGAEHAPCRDDIDCYGDSRCINIMTNAPAAADRSSPWNRCRCNMFHPRERHAVAVYDNKLFVSGGIINVKVSDCGMFPCNGGYEKIADDIWYSTDGELWTQLEDVSHAYSDHGLIESGGVLWLVSLHQDPVDALSVKQSNQVWKNEKRGVFLKGVPFPRTEEQHDIPDDIFDEKFIYIEQADTIYKYVEQVGWQLISEETNNVRGETYVWDTAPVERIKGGITPEEVAKLNAKGVHTIRDLATLDANSIVDFRSNDKITYICIYAKRALAVLNKCVLKKEYPDGYNDFAVNVKPQSPMTHPFPSLRGATSTRRVPSSDEDGSELVEAEQEEQEEQDGANEGHYIYGYDGCQQAELEEERFAHLDDIPALQEDAERGFIPDLTCRWGFPERTNLGAINFKGKQYIVGGWLLNRPDNLVLEEKGDTWYRDDTVPVTLMIVKPDDSSSDTLFVFECDERNCLFEYMIEVLNEDDDTVLETLRQWTRTTGESLDLLTWLPGGRYRMKARAIDPAGNYDNQFVEGRNQHTWTYVPKIPVGLILGILLTFVLIGLAVYLEIRRRKKKAALERYALKRMRRKFKNMQKKNKKTKEAKKKGGKKGAAKKGATKKGDAKKKPAKKGAKKGKKAK